MMEKVQASSNFHMFYSSGIDDMVLVQDVQ